MSTKPNFAAGASKPGAVASELESLLCALIAEHETWRGLVDVQRDAIRRADGRDLRTCAEQQSEVLQSIVELEDRRRRLVGRAGGGAERSAGDPAGPITLTRIAEALPEPSRSKLVDLAARLKTLLADIHEQNQKLRAATGSLAAHMDGLMRQVSRRLSHAGLYGRRGFADRTPTVVSAVDLTR